MRLHTCTCGDSRSCLPFLLGPSKTLAFRATDLNIYLVHTQNDARSDTAHNTMLAKRMIARALGTTWMSRGHATLAGTVSMHAKSRGLQEHGNCAR
jgi:RsiW-degrading membrane proteinase PrsW (M82 family)